MPSLKHHTVVLHVMHMPSGALFTRQITNNNNRYRIWVPHAARLTNCTLCVQPMPLSCAGDTKFQLTFLSNARNIHCQPCSATPRRPTELFVIDEISAARLASGKTTAWNRHAATACYERLLLYLRIVPRCVRCISFVSYRGVCTRDMQARRSGRYCSKNYISSGSAPDLRITPPCTTCPPRAR